MITDTYTFRTFVVGHQPHAALAAAMAVATNPGRVHNPLVLLGGIGAGKTHLLFAIAHAMRADRPQAEILHIDGWLFLNRLIEACRDHELETLRRDITRLDALLLDNLHILEGKEHSQTELILTIEELLKRRRQVVVTSDARSGFLPRLQRRLESTFVAEIAVPDEVARGEIARSTACGRNIELPPELEREIARTSIRSPREIHNLIARFHALSAITKL